MMHRQTSPNDLFFPVRIVPICANIQDGEGDAIGISIKTVEIPTSKAIVDCRTGNIVSLVGKNYQLVTNQKALDYAYRCCEMLFPEVSSCEWKIKHAYLSSMGGNCRFDLEHNSVNFDLGMSKNGEFNDIFGPFIRVINSYDRTHALHFDIGIMRKVCSNGMIMPQSIINIHFKHNQRIEEQLDHAIGKDEFRCVKSNFLNFVRPLRQYEIPGQHFIPICFSVLQIEEPQDDSLNNWKDWKRLNSDLRWRCDYYIDELGENAYTLLNVITDFATRPLESPLLSKEQHELQRLAGTWLAEFGQACQEPNFNIQDYVSGLPKADNKPILESIPEGPRELEPVRSPGWLAPQGFR